MTDQQRELVLHLLSVGDWTSAIDTLQEETGADRESATQIIEELASRHGLQRRSMRLLWPCLGGIAFCGVYLWLVRF